MKNFIYADNAATTPVKTAVLQEMLPYFSENFGNASAVYSIAHQSKIAVDKARKQVAAALGCMPEEIYFTAGGSESDNWAIKGTAFALKNKYGKNHIITTRIEHHAVLHTVEYLAKQGFEITLLDVDRYGMVNPEDVKKAIKPTTALVSVMFANNEIGTVQPVEEIGTICRENNVWFHTDAVQAVGAVKINVKQQNIDMLSLSAHKFGGPKGIGALYIKKGIVIDNFIHGGGQEKGKRAGTENVAAIVGLSKAIELASADIDAKAQKLCSLRKILCDKVLALPKSRLNGHPDSRLPGNTHFCFEGIEGEGLLLHLDMHGICASSGSACTSGSLDPSHVLLAIGLPHEIAHGSLRITLGENNTAQEAEYIAEKIVETVNRLRAMSPVWDKL